MEIYSSAISVMRRQAYETDNQFPITISAAIRKIPRVRCRNHEDNLPKQFRLSHLSINCEFEKQFEKFSLLEC